MTIRALLADDDGDTRAVVALALEADPRFTVRAVSRLDAVEALHRDADGFDALVLDLKQADMSAAALIATMRQWATRPIPVVLLSARAGERERRSYRSAGAKGVIAKPLDPVALPEQVAALLA
jgi:CheY-like chemotaxis protein